MALPLLVLDLTGAPFDAGLMRFHATLPLLLFYLPAGAIVDRDDRRVVMLATEGGRILALGSLALGSPTSSTRARTVKEDRDG